MEILSHLLKGEGVKFVADPRPVSIIVPRLIVIHFAVTRSNKQTVDVLKAKPESCHFAVDGSEIVQMVPCNERAGHAGKSHWRDLDGCNDFSIGIEIANPGPLLKTSKGFTDIYKNPWKGEVFEGCHRNDVAKQGYRYWAAFTPETVAKVAELCKTLITAYPTIEDVRGHDEIAPGRKIDPGPAFDVAALRKLLNAAPVNVPSAGVTIGVK